MEEKLGQSTAVLFKYEKLILAEEETTSAGGCGVSLAAFSRPASACPSDRVSRGVFLSLERPANKSQVEISGFGSSEKGNTKSSR